MLLLQGTNFVNFMGRYVYVASGSKGFSAVVTAEHDEPEAVIGSDLQRMAYPDDFRKHVDRKTANSRWRIGMTELFSTSSFAENTHTRRWVPEAFAFSTSPTLTTRVSPSAW